MDSKGGQWHGSGPHYHPGGYGRHHPRDWDERHRPPHRGPGPNPPSAPRDRAWTPVDPRYSHYPTSPTPAADYGPGYRHGYGMDRQGPPHPHSHQRQGYDYASHNYWGYREDYGYYDHNYPQGYYGYPDPGPWAQQETWRSDPYHEQQVSSGAHAAQYRSDQRRESVPCEYGSSEADRRRDNGENAGQVSRYSPGALAVSKTSGLSSSSYELSQYINGADPHDLHDPNDPHTTTHTEHTSKPQVAAPMKFCLPHVVVSFGPAGQLVRVSPGPASEGEPGLVELHSMEVILSETQEQQEMRDFPGPLAREDLHKTDVINFALQQAEACLKDDTLTDGASAALLWQLLVLLCRQNGRIVGSDIAELLVRDPRSLGACEATAEKLDGPSLIDLSEAPTPETETLDTSDLLTGSGHTVTESAQDTLQNYTKLLLAGRKKEALESAMKSGLWGHALFLASKMDGRSYTTVLSRFTGSLAPSDPLQTLFQLLSGRIPAVATCCSSERWGDWKPHLAVMLSNDTGDGSTHRRSIITMGDTMAAHGQLHAAHICYLTARATFGAYSNRAGRLVLLGVSHSCPFGRFCQNSAIRCTEVFEYSQRLGDPAADIPAFQVYKFLYACRLLDAGLASQAFHYCELVAKALIRAQEPHMVLLGEVIKLAERLHLLESQLSDTGVDQTFQSPDWLVQLRYRQEGKQMGGYGFSWTHRSPEQNAWAHTDSREELGLDTDDLPKDGEVISYIQEPHGEGPHQENTEDYYTHQIYTPQDQTYTPNPQTYTPQDQTYTPNPQTYTPQDQTCTPNPQTYTPQDQIYTPNPQTYTPQDQTYTPNPQTYTPQDQTYTPNPQTYTPQDQTYTTNPQTFTPQDQTYTPNTQTYPPQEQTHTTQQQMYTPQQQAYTPYGQMYTPGNPAYTPAQQTAQSSPPDQFPQGQGPVPAHPAQGPVGVPLTLPTESALTGEGSIAGTPPVTGNQYPDPRFTSGSNSQTEPSDMMGVHSNGAMNLGGASQQEMKKKPAEEPEKSSGWFSGWFRSKPKESSKQTNHQGPSPAPMEATPPPPPPVPVSPPGPGHSHALSPGVNPFSRRAGQQPSQPIGQHRGSMVTGP